MRSTHEMRWWPASAGGELLRSAAAPGPAAATPPQPATAAARALPGPVSAPALPVTAAMNAGTYACGSPCFLAYVRRSPASTKPLPSASISLNVRRSRECLAEVAEGGCQAGGITSVLLCGCLDEGSKVLCLVSCWLGCVRRAHALMPAVADTVMRSGLTRAWRRRWWTAKRTLGRAAAAAAAAAGGAAAPARAHPPRHRLAAHA